MRYHYSHIRNLASEARSRFDNLLHALQMCDSGYGKDEIYIDGMTVRLAVDDFKTILAEIRKLK